MANHSAKSFVCELYVITIRHTYFDSQIDLSFSYSLFHLFIDWSGEISANDDQWDPDRLKMTFFAR